MHIIYISESRYGLQWCYFDW